MAFSRLSKYIYIFFFTIYFNYLNVLVQLCGMCASVTPDLLCDLCHSLLQVVILLGQSSILLEQRLADSGSQLQISLFLSDGGEDALLQSSPPSVFGKSVLLILQRESELFSLKYNFLEDIKSMTVIKKVSWCVKKQQNHLLQQTCDGVDVIVGLRHLAHSVCT